MKERSGEEKRGTGEDRRHEGEFKTGQGRRREARKGIPGQREACSCRSVENVLPWRRRRCAERQVGEVSQVSAGSALAQGRLCLPHLSAPSHRAKTP